MPWNRTLTAGERVFDIKNLVAKIVFVEKLSPLIDFR